ncbi:MAG TPA: hypothetical protein VHW46_17905 [Terracidiphilus sp.]|jgi:5-hydroxyisourate hydrolase-like protein (transthyretin family)|nr:hypothetical protein [Terracidiphilus sp.]
MGRRIGQVLLLVACASLAGLAAHAQKQVTVRVLDGKTGEKITPDNIEVRVNRQQTNHIEWVKVNDDGTVQLSLPAQATSLSVRATYANSIEYYVNCDMTKQKDTSLDSWYPVSDILRSGLAIPNDCVRPKDADKVKVEAKPGEFVLFVRKRNWKEQVLQ